MPSVHEHFSEQFHNWEVRGRGWQMFPNPVSPEPPFRPFLGYTLAPAIDDGRRPTVLSSLVEGLSRWLATAPAPLPRETEPEAEPCVFERASVVELQTILPAKLDIKGEAFGTFLDRLGVCRDPLAFELLGTHDRIIAQFAMSPTDESVVRRQLNSFFPEVAFLPGEETLANEWDASGPETLIVEFGLEREFLLPLATGRDLDPFLGLIATLSELGTDELALFQVLFQPVQHDWRGNTWRALTDREDKAVFVREPQLLIGAKEKFAATAYGVIVRIAVKSESYERVTQLAREMAYALRVFANPEGNGLIPLHNEDYPVDAHETDVLLRQSHRSGMVLSARELTGLVHFPGTEVRSPKLRPATGRTKAAPASVLNHDALVLGVNRHAGKSVTVGLTPDQRVRHMDIIGASGSGKSTLLLNMIRQDIMAGMGIGVLDPHGDLIDRILESIPRRRLDDVVLIDPADAEHAVGFNILSAHSDAEKVLLASDLVSIFQRLSSSWGDQLGSVFQNAVMAFLESSQGGTLADLQRFLIEPAYRNAFLKTVRDSRVVYYWQKAFPLLGSGKSIGPVITRLEKLLALKPVRYLLVQPGNRLDFADMLDTGKIFLAKLSKGEIGDENSYLVGSLLMAKFQQMAMNRQRLAATKRRDFMLYLDEAHNFITPSMAEIITGTRKYRLGLVLAHHNLQQLEADRAVADAVMSSVYSRVIFRVGDSDAKKLAEGLSFFEPQDLQNLGTGEAIVRIERNDGDFNLSIPPAETFEATEGVAAREEIIAASRKKYALARADIEAAVEVPVDSVEEKPAPKVKKTAPPPAAKPIVPESPKPEDTVSKKEVPLPGPVAMPVPLPIPEVEPPKPAVAPKPPAAPSTMGIGGPDHKAIQERIRQEAQALGFLSHVEKSVESGLVDVLLKRGPLTIACEISLTTTVEHEVANVAKCLAAGYSQVAVVSTRPKQLAQIASAVKAAFAADQVALVSFYLPDELLAYLKTLPVAPAEPASPKESNVRGYKIKRHAKSLTAEEKQAREAAAVKLMADAMRKQQ